MTARRTTESPTRAPIAPDRDTGIATLELRMARAVEVAAERASEARAPRVASVTVDVPARDPIALLDAAHAAGHGAALWARPDEGLALIGVGEEWSVASDERSGIADAGTAWLALVRDAVCDSTANTADRVAEGGTHAPLERWGSGPVAVGGFAFDLRAPVARPWTPFGRGSLVLPRIAILSTSGGCEATLNVVVRPGRGAAGAARDTVAALSRLLQAPPTLRPPGDDARSPKSFVIEELRPASEWRSVVAEAAAAARRGPLRKVVVARGVRVRTGEVEAARVLARLWAEYPSCALFAISRSDGSGRHRWFVGATPERLVRVRAGSVTAMALAGSAPRGADESEDRRLGETLLASAKNRVEHALVVDVMREALGVACEAVKIEDGPVLLRLSNVQHLHTPMSARLRSGTSVLDLVDRLHPTPAVGGVPRTDAIAWLRRHEGLDRGWYAGPVGWIDRHGEGEFSVALRCALLGRGESLLYTGCGIVASSVPAFEYAESRLKLRPMLSALGAGRGASAQVDAQS